jgi:hypothetical protein
MPSKRDEMRFLDPAVPPGRGKDMVAGGECGSDDEMEEGMMFCWPEPNSTQVPVASNAKPCGRENVLGQVTREGVSETELAAGGKRRDSRKKEEGGDGGGGVKG